MQITIAQKENKRKIKRQWMQRAGTAGFVFFFTKGVVWIVAAVWVAY